MKLYWNCETDTRGIPREPGKAFRDVTGIFLAAGAGRSGFFRQGRGGGMCGSAGGLPPVTPRNRA